MQFQNIVAITVALLTSTGAALQVNWYNFSTLQTCLDPLESK